MINTVISPHSAQGSSRDELGACDGLETASNNCVNLHKKKKKVLDDAEVRHASA